MGRVLPLKSEMLLGEFVLAIVDIIWWSSIADIHPSHLGPLRFTGKIVIYRRCRHALSCHPFVWARMSVKVFHGKENEPLKFSAWSNAVGTICESLKKSNIRESLLTIYHTIIYCNTTFSRWMRLSAILAFFF